MTQWLTAKEAAEHVRLSERAFRMAVLAGRYPQGRAVALGRRKVWRASDLDAALTGEGMTTPLDELAEQIGAAILDAIEQNRRINKADLVDAAHSVLRRRRSLLGMEQAPGASSDTYIERQSLSGVWGQAKVQVSQEVWDRMFSQEDGV